MWWSYSFLVSVRMLIPLNRIQRNNEKYCTFNAQNYICQCVVVHVFLVQAADSSACEQSKLKKQWELFSTSPIRHFSISLWWCISLSMTVWPQTAANENQSRNIWTCSAFNPSPVCPSVCDGFLVCLWMCGCGHPQTKLNPETSGPVHHLTHQGMFVNMWWYCSLHLIVWMQIPVN